MAGAIDAAALDQIFLAARSQNKWLDKDVPDSLLTQIVETMKMGPTSANCLPARIVFVKSAAAKAKLEPALADKGEGFRMQLERVGYFCKDRDSTSERPVWNRTIGLKDSWTKEKGA